MKSIFFSLVGLICCFYGSAQDCDISRYRTLLKESERAVSKGFYEVAIRKLESAKICQPDSSVALNKRLEKVFATINKQRIIAQQALARETVARKKIEKDIVSANINLGAALALQRRNYHLALHLSNLACNVDTLKFLPPIKTRHDLLSQHLGWAKLNVDAGPETVASISFSPDGQYFITTHSYGPAKLWSREGEHLATYYTESYGFVRDTLYKKFFSSGSAAFSSDGMQVLVVTNHKFSLWSIDGQLIDTITPRLTTVRDFVFNAQNEIIYCNDDGKLDVCSFSQRGKQAPPQASKYSVSQIIKRPDSDAFITLNQDKTITIWNEDFTQKAKVPLDVFRVDFAGAFHQTQQYYTVTDNIIKVWNTDGTNAYDLEVAIEEKVTNVMLSPDDAYFLFLDKTGVVWVFSRYGKLINKITVTGDNGVRKTEGNAWFNQSGPALAVLAVSTDGLLLTANTDYHLQGWNYLDQNVLREINVPDKRQIFNVLAVDTVGQRIAFADEYGVVNVYDINSQHVTPLNDWSFNHFAADFSRSGRYLVVADAEGVVRIWDTYSSEMTGQISIQGTKYFSPYFLDETRIIIPENKPLGIYDIHGKLLNTIGNGAPEPSKGPSSGPLAQIMGYSYLPDSINLAIGFRDNGLLSPDGQHILKSVFDFGSNMPATNIRIYDRQGKLKHSFGPCPFSPAHFITNDRLLIAGKVYALNGQELYSYCGHGGSVLTIDCSSDGNFLLTAGADDRVVKLWSKERVELQTFGGFPAPPTKAIFSPNQSVIAVRCGKTVVLFPVSDPAKRVSIVSANPVVNLAFSVDGACIAVSSATDTFSLFSTDGVKIRDFTGKIGQISAFSFAKNGKTFVTAGADGVVRLWNMEGRQLEKYVDVQARLTFVRFVSDDKQIVTAHMGGKINLWNVNGKLENYFITGDNNVRSVTADNQGKYLFSTGLNGLIKVWSPIQIAHDQPLETYNVSLGAPSDAPSLTLAKLGNISDTLVVGGYGKPIFLKHDLYSLDQHIQPADLTVRQSIEAGLFTLQDCWDSNNAKLLKGGSRFLLFQAGEGYAIMQQNIAAILEAQKFIEKALTLEPDNEALVLKDYLDHLLKMLNNPLVPYGK